MRRCHVTQDTQDTQYDQDTQDGFSSWRSWVSRVSWPRGGKEHEMTRNGITDPMDPNFVPYYERQGLDAEGMADEWLENY